MVLDDSSAGVRNLLSDRDQVYNRVAHKYDAERPEQTYEDTLAVYLGIINDRAPRARRVLDLGCGTGRLTALLAGQGFEVVGVDSASEMLHVARERGGPATYVRADLLDLPDLGEFDVVVTTGQPFSCLGSVSELANVLTRVRALMSENGLLLFDLLGPRAARAMLGGAHVIDSGAEIVVHRAVADAGQPQRITMTEYRFEPRGPLWELLTGEHFYTIFDAREIERQLHEAGFSETALHGIHREFHELYSEDDHALCLAVARR